MFIIQALADAARWLAEGLAAVWQPIEPVAIALYLIVIALLGLWVCYQSGRGAKILGAAILVMIVGEAFRLIPRIIADIAPPGAFADEWRDQSTALNIGKLVSSLMIAGSFLLLELFRQERFGTSADVKTRRMEKSFFVLFAATAMTCFVPYNEWISGNTPAFWLIVRNLLLVTMGLIEGVLWIGPAAKEAVFRRVPLALGLSLLFYLPAALLEKAVPETTYLMIFRGAMLAWLVWMLRGSALVRGTGYSFKTYLKRYWTLYLLLLIPIAFFALFRYYPMSYISLAFKKDWITMHPWEIPLADKGGMEYFIAAFNHKDFWLALKNTIFLNLLDLVIGMPMPIIMALLLNELAFPKYKRITQTILYLPHFLSWVIISTIALRLFAKSDGMVNQLFGTEIPFLAEDNHWRASYIVLGIWKECGWNTIIYLAALTGINAELYEAAEVDGAGRLKKIWHVTLPGIRPTIIVLLIMNLGRILGSEFDRPYTLQNPLVNTVSQTISIYVYEYGIKGGQHSLTTAVGIFQSLVCVIFLVGSNTLAKKFGERGIW